VFALVAIVSTSTVLLALATNTTKIPAKPNIIVFVTDDQRADTIQYMPNVKNLMQRQGITFENAFATTPLCCPFRASFFSGGFYPYETGVLSNTKVNGGMYRFIDENSMPVKLQDSGYKTAMIGKYLNNYFEFAPYIPPGWDTFLTANDEYYNFTVVRGISGADGIQEQVAGIYKTNYIRDRSIEFLEESRDEPFFLYIAFHGPHPPYVREQQDIGTFSDLHYSSPGIEENELGDKPLIIRKGFKVDAKFNDNIQKQLEMLQSIDRVVASVINHVDKLGLSDNTIFMLTSDNGFNWGEHGTYGKSLPYEESVKVPLVIMKEGMTVRNITELVAANLDIPATIYNLAGIDSETDGISLLPFMEGQDPEWRKGLVLQSFVNENTYLHGHVIPWAAWRTDTWKYIEYANGEKELYKLKDDPYELDSKHKNSKYEDMMARFSAEIDESRGLTILTQPSMIPKAAIGEPYHFKFETWGGEAPFTWTINKLPAGLALTQAGELIGSPTSAENYGKRLTIVVDDSSESRYDGEPQRYKLLFDIDLQ
jgi:arylsulfatase A-like enzyme